ncbi:MAG: UbiA family prenyltransferase [Candidatus Pacebacteria bacterium]|nr:UbiA family prenyltransferase [Candidatus Paceibacterota bacterium]
MHSLSFKRLLLISRPRIWIYTAGSFLLGIFYSQSFNIPTSHILVSFPTWKIIYTVFWLTIPANIFLYALNDAYDTGTDEDNPKKDGFEIKADSSDKKTLLVISLISVLLYLPIIFSLDLIAQTIFLIWILIVVTYNVPPLRFKMRPIVDNLFALNFPLWGVFGYYLIQGNLPTNFTLAMIAVFATVMHIYTASGDIEFDRRDGIYTTAVLIGSIKKTLLVCLLLTAILMCGLWIQGLPELSIAMSLYFIYFLYQLSSKISPHILYKYYIYLHYIVGFVYFSLKL